ncbi:nucleic-acid-binding protein from transposon X-element [Trichonephila clavipes]|nr:nucleic-acid-binding protein from transposon X-element [Trichonephila clavipes]
MFGARVAFEPCDGSRNRRPNQYWCCQGFFHSSEVCHLPMKCLKCAEPHQAKDCTLQFEGPLKCASFGGEHAANWRQCPRFSKVKKAPHHQNKGGNIKNNNSKPSNKNINQRNQNTAPEICFWNANGLRPKTCEVRDFVSEQNPDLLLAQETKLQPGLDPLIAIEITFHVLEQMEKLSKSKFKPPSLKLPSEIKAKIHHRNRVRKFWQRTRDPAGKSEFRTLSRKVEKDIRHFSQSHWESHIAALTPEAGTLWRKISLFKKPPQNIRPPKEALVSVANHYPLEKAEVIADSLQK